MTAPKSERFTRPCPWCKTARHLFVNVWIFGAVVGCRRCGARGPAFELERGHVPRCDRTEAKAVALWNGR